MPVAVDVKKIGTFTRLVDRTTIPDGLPPKLNTRNDLYGTLEERLDLSLGFEDYKDEGHGDKFQSLCDYLMKTSEPGSSLNEVIGADFVSNRRNLQVLAQSPYKKVDMEIQAIRLNGVIFLCDKAEDDPAGRDLPYGYKFEQYMTLDSDGNSRSKYERVSNAEAAKALLRTTFSSGKDKVKVLYAAEMDAIDEEGNFVELKTTSHGHYKWLDRTSLATYLQSALGGVPYIIRGRKVSWREPVVFKTDTIWTKSIPTMGVHWKKDVCFETLFKVLQKIKSKLEYDEEALVVKIERGEEISFEPECSNNCTFIDPKFLEHFN